MTTIAKLSTAKVFRCRAPNTSPGVPMTTWAWPPLVESIALPDVMTCPRQKAGTIFLSLLSLLVMLLLLLSGQAQTSRTNWMMHSSHNHEA